jgi:hypothetical protein
VTTRRNDDVLPAVLPARPGGQFIPDLNQEVDAVSLNRRFQSRYQLLMRSLTSLQKPRWAITIPFRQLVGTILSKRSSTAQ